KVRERVGMPSIVSGSFNNAQLLEIVRHERLVELALEGLRFFDLRRWKVAEHVMNGPIEGMHYIPIGEQTNAENIKTLRYNGTIRSFDPERDYLFPIPQQEILLLPNIEQNPGY